MKRRKKNNKIKKGSHCNNTHRERDTSKEYDEMEEKYGKKTFSLQKSALFKILLLFFFHFRQFSAWANGKLLKFKNYLGYCVTKFQQSNVCDRRMELDLLLNCSSN